MSILQLYLEDEAALVAFGLRLAQRLPPGSCVYLRGELGAGKTTLVRGVARGLGHVGAVTSPTYTLVEPYEHLNPVLYHFDLYRLGDAEELEFMGLRDYFGGSALVFIEWPERGGGFLPTPDLEIRLGVEASGRRLELEAYGERGTACVDALAADERRD
ncbi:MAG: tRNA (adenosine(37)-N6)-threonylcarbamoyltransferase complex ATPase subunit type 1 TsaE [Halieaceae bacterium]|nr:tRNA (adenosine(37)-N6)-threonylcarbamoyltransferase complex ATPase subunit type 1 TsaE [Halieaceae bacterium]